MGGEEGKGGGEERGEGYRREEGKGEEGKREEGKGEKGIGEMRGRERRGRERRGKERRGWERRGKRGGRNMHGRNGSISSACLSPGHICTVQCVHISSPTLQSVCLRLSDTLTEGWQDDKVTNTLQSDRVTQ